MFNSVEEMVCKSITASSMSLRAWRSSTLKVKSLSTAPGLENVMRSDYHAAIQSIFCTDNFGKRTYPFFQIMFKPSNVTHPTFDTICYKHAVYDRVMDCFSLRTPFFEQSFKLSLK